ncbi:MAG: RNA 2',3'-cyclic phosphodiesterase [Coriobacteriia bacterium]|nr:RNA 2',3'-cyclic phosphodiesterase [Coriobacteriia bacterium]
MQELMRLFVAINFSDEVRGDLAAVSDELRRRSQKGRFTLSENLHMTLAFLGECGPDQYEKAKSAINALTFYPFEIRIEGIDRFKRREGDIWWIGAKKNSELTHLQKELVAELRVLGFDIEKRPFIPHVTLGRQVRLKESMSPGGLIGVSVRQQVDSIELMRSERHAGRLGYTTLHEKNSLSLFSFENERY